MAIITNSAGVKTRVLIISDTHCAPLAPEDAATDVQRSLITPPFQHPLPKADLLIHCGDLTATGQLDEYHATLDMLKRIDAPVKLVIAGNHDLTLDRDFVLSHLGLFQRSADEADAMWQEARDLWTSPTGRARQEGITFLDEGTHRVELANGASITLHSSPYTPEFCDWGFPYDKHEDRFNTPATSLDDAANIAPYPVPSHADIIPSPPIDLLLTHGPPFALLDTTVRGDSVGCPHLLRAVMRARPLVHCFGHIHEGWGAQRVRWAGAGGQAADELVATKHSSADWMAGSWKDGVEGSPRALDVDVRNAVDGHGVLLDLSSTGADPIERGKETLLVNAAIMDVQYRPVNSPWLIDLDLPSA